MELPYRTTLLKFCEQSSIRPRNFLFIRAADWVLPVLQRRQMGIELTIDIESAILLWSMRLLGDLGRCP